MDKNVPCKKIVLSSKWSLHDKNNNSVVSVENLSNDNETITKSSCKAMNQKLLKNDDDKNSSFETKDNFENTKILSGNQNKTNNEELNTENSNKNYELIQ